MTSLLVRNMQVNHATIAEQRHGVSTALFDKTADPACDEPVDRAPAAPRSTASVNTQAAIIAYIDDFKLMMILALAAMPLVLLLRGAAAPSAAEHAVVME